MEHPASEERQLALITIGADAFATLNQRPIYGYADGRLDHQYDLATDDVPADLADGTLFGRTGFSPLSEVIATL